MSLMKHAVFFTLSIGLCDAALAAPDTLDDKKILNIVHSANVGEIDAGKLAGSRARDERVKKFAAMMVEHHTDADKKGDDTAKQLKVELTPSPASQELDKSNATDAAKLKAAPAGDFDRAYIDAQVQGHTKVLSMIDSQLIPNAKAPAVQKLLRDVRPTVASHLDQAKSLKASLK